MLINFFYVTLLLVGQWMQSASMCLLNEVSGRTMGYICRVLYRWPQLVPTIKYFEAIRAFSSVYSWTDYHLPGGQTKCLFICSLISALLHCQARLQTVSAYSEHSLYSRAKHQLLPLRPLPLLLLLTPCSNDRSMTSVSLVGSTGTDWQHGCSCRLLHARRLFCASHEIENAVGGLTGQCDVVAHPPLLQSVRSLETNCCVSTSNISTIHCKTTPALATDHPWRPPTERL